MTLLGESLIVAAQCQAQFVCITGVGAIGAARKILDGRALSLLSRLYLRLLLPCLMLGLSTSFSVERLQEWSPILVVACCHVALGFGLGRLAALAMRLQSPHTELLVLTVAFGNCGSLPFVLVLPVATNWKAMRDHPGALSEGMAVIGLCARRTHARTPCRPVGSHSTLRCCAADLLAWFVLMFALGMPYLDRALARAGPPPAIAMRPSSQPAAASEEEEAVVPTEPAERMTPPPAAPCGRLAAAWRCMLALDPMLGWIVLSVCLGCVPPLQDALSQRGALAWLQHSWSSLGMAGVIVSTIVLGGGLWRSAWPVRGGKAAWEAPREAVAMEAVAVEAVAVEVEPVCTSARGGESCGADDLAPEAGSLPGDLPQARARGAPSLASLVGAACVVRLVLLPAIAIPLTAVAASAGLLPARPMLLIVSHMQSAVPSSQTFVAMLHERGESELAARVSKIYLPQYAMSVLTVAAVIVLAIQIIEGAGMAVPAAPHDGTSAHL